MKYYLTKRMFSVSDRATLKNELGEVVFKIKGRFFNGSSGQKLTITNVDNSVKARVNNRIGTAIHKLTKWSEISIENKREFIFRFKDSVSFEFENLNWKLNLLTLSLELMQKNKLNSNVYYELIDEKKEVIMKSYSLKTQVTKKYMLEVENEAHLLQCLCIVLGLYF